MSRYFLLPYLAASGRVCSRLPLPVGGGQGHAAAGQKGGQVIAPIHRQQQGGGGQTAGGRIQVTGDGDDLVYRRQAHGGMNETKP